MIMKRLQKYLSFWNISIDDDRLRLFEEYYDLLVSWNSRMNLTSITSREDVIIKHFVDSVALLRYIDVSGKTFLDVGTGAGFPGIPIKIMIPECNVVLLDSLKKRVTFLDQVIGDLDLNNITAVHDRAEIIAFDESFREKFDIVTSRAVAELRTLCEYCLPFVSVNGSFISYKSGSVDEEVNDSLNAIGKLGGSLNRIEKFFLPDTDVTRSLVFIDKIDITPERYPRKAGVPLKKPL